MYVCLFIYLYFNVYIHIYVLIYIYIYICVCVCVCVVVSSSLIDTDFLHFHTIAKNSAAKVWLHKKYERICLYICACGVCLLD